jgi:hypothetical protein
MLASRKRQVKQEDADRGEAAEGALEMMLFGSVIEIPNPAR